jgi:RHS repeat-associated protein
VNIPSVHGFVLNAAPASTANQLNGFCNDAAGNLVLNSPCPTGTFTPAYSYDDENRLSSTAGITYGYDADGARVVKSSGTLYWPGLGGQVLTEANFSGLVEEEYVYFNGQRIARLDNPLPIVAVHYYFSDHLGSASVITDQSGYIQEQYYYYPYGGQLVTSTGSDSNRYKFTGKERDTESNLDMFGARYYASTMGRFMTPDWSATPEAIPYGELSNPQSLNRYSYVKNNPTTLTDPDGHCDIDGEHHGWVWCAAHALNFTQTQHEQAENARFQLSFFGQIYMNGQPVNLQKTSDKDVIQLEKDFFIANALGQVRTIDPTATAGAVLGTATQIANGHSWTKHQGEFPGWDKGKFESTVGDTMQNPDEVKSLSNNRTAYWNSKENMVVIKDPANADGGTAFRPTNGKAYFDGLK